MSAAAREAARLMAVVVLPTPPFWFVIAMTRAAIDVPRGTPLESFHVEHIGEGLGQIWSSRKSQTSELLPGTEIREAVLVGAVAPEVIQTTRVVSGKMRRNPFINCGVGLTA